MAKPLLGLLMDVGLGAPKLPSARRDWVAAGTSGSQLEAQQLEAQHGTGGNSRTMPPRIPHTRILRPSVPAELRVTALLQAGSHLCRCPRIQDSSCALIVSLRNCLPLP
jgi:hypothetical protein